MWFGILGAIEARGVDGIPIALGGPRPRALLALLLLDTGQVVGTSRLIDDLYGENPPKEAANALQSLVSRLRRKLGANLIEFHPGGYRLKVAPEQVDVHRFTRLAREGREALAGGRPVAAAALLGDALELWRGPAQVPGPQAARLEELRLAAVEDRAEAVLAGAGEPRELVTRLRELAADHPLRERLRGLLMRALEASGRQAEALTVFEDTRRTLADELGADPSPELTGTHLAILTAEPIRVTGVPAQLTSFVGRDEELERIRGLLSTARLVTLTGPGGMGKTRLAIQAGTGTGKAASMGEVCFVDLAVLTDGTQVPQAVLAALGLRETGIFSSPRHGPDPAERLTAALRDRPLLLIFDNCEHVIAEAAALVHRLLTACPGLRVLATSREPLGITGEALCPLPPLPLDRAVALFADRARAVSPDFAGADFLAGSSVARICRALDGLPLAIELAAARLRSLTIAQLEARLDDRFRLLSRGSRTAAPRHQTLRAVVGWSWDLLDPREQRLLRRLAVFAGGATAGAAAQVLSEVDAEDLLEALADKSLVEVTAEGTLGRYRMLDTIREFSAERLAEAGEHEPLARAHAEYFLDLARRADPHLRGAGQLTWLARLGAEHANLHVALRWAVSADPPLALRFIGALTPYWYLRGARGEVVPLAMRLLDGLEPPEGLEEEYVLAVLSALPNPPEDALYRAKTIMRTRTWPMRQPYLMVAWALFSGPPEDGAPPLPLYHQLATSDDPWFQALIHFSTSYRRIFTGDLPAAEAEFAKSLAGFRSVGDRWGIAQVLDGLAVLAARQGDPGRALALTEEAIAEMTPLGAVDEIAELACRRADLLLREGKIEAAETGYAEAGELVRRTGRPATMAMVHHGYGRVAQFRGDHAEARRRFRQALQACGPDWQSIALRSLVLSSLALLDGNGERAARLLGAAAAIGSPIHDPESIDRARELIGTAAYDAAFSHGAAMCREDALTFIGTR